MKAADERNCDLAELPLDALQSIDARIDENVRELLTLDASVAGRTSYGGAAPVRVREQVAAARDALGMGEIR